jgi:hypothetical protein
MSGTVFFYSTLFGSHRETGLGRQSNLFKVKQSVMVALEFELGVPCFLDGPIHP